MTRHWTYTALDRDGRTLRGRLAAADEAGVARLLGRSGAVPLAIRPERSGLLGLTRESLSRRELSQMLRELATMLGAGQDLDHALSFLEQTASGQRARRVLTELHDAVRNGSALAEAMAARPNSFPRLVVGIVRGGEAGGSLAVTLERLATLAERQQALAASIQSALIYPVLLVVAASAAIALLLTQILPQFVPLFEQNGVALPASTRLLLDAGDALGRFWPIGLAGCLLLGLVAAMVARQASVRLALDRLALRVPVAGRLQREILAARLCRTLGTLLQNGVPLIPALAIARDVLGNQAAVAALDTATATARDGGGLAGPLGQGGVFPARTIHLLRLGEETAQLAVLALRAADIHEETARISAQRLTGLMTPVITIVMGAVIAGIVSQLLLAMLSLNDLAQ